MSLVATGSADPDFRIGGQAMMTAFLEAQNLTDVYRRGDPEVAALSSVSFSADRGELWLTRRRFARAASAAPEERCAFQATHLSQPPPKGHIAVALRTYMRSGMPTLEVPLQHGQTLQCSGQRWTRAPISYPAL